MPYADASTQTIWAGLTKGDLVRPEFLLTLPDTTTPPDDMLTQKSQSVVAVPRSLRLQPRLPSLWERRGNHPVLARGIPMPRPSIASRLGEELTASPPPTHAVLSPLPAANKLYAGHTPLIPGSPSPEDEDEDVKPPVASELVVEANDDADINDQSTTPQQDPSLAGALSLPTLPTNPLDGTEEFIVLNDLDRALEEVARDQERFARLKDAPDHAPSSSSASASPPASASASASAAETSPEQTESTSSSERVTDDGLSLSRKGSADSRTSNVSYVNGVPLKSPPLNFGVPMGQLQRD
ncbi:hypothetical protein IAQ61_007193 [Plenodomus lingam]|uniref:Uncharacterized protein n=1 Tax=Leptosphaeria maculans (strain JN3 / isolate v23.1.3 / race Av1-4-5-6-7-8) TaxID=985895 RepID=E5A1C3_LEPMJ|nr:hypothetical protein LEMA_P105180.1 [Plenodomus lingam JN3]KAH9867889.1 hypothetical protein IAQ61_007193 [Plenodomus lingam]CBX97387.1 hypothetical protein LEMA_P105180.1 [Plenodomus lingam JN3]